LDITGVGQSMRIAQISVARPKDVMFDGKTTSTSIFKVPVDSEVFADFINLQGDTQSDLSVHGGRDKALYFYSLDYYPLWARELSRPELDPAQFGENLTVTGCVDEDIVIGVRLRVGNAEVTVTQPRIPCFKLGIRMGDANFPNRFWATGRLGFYARVERTGPLKRGDAIEVLETPSHGITVRKLWRIVTGKRSSEARQAMEQLADLDAGWQRRLRQAAADK
jgi:MOSC domain-containing protein YiiM